MSDSSLPTSLPLRSVFPRKVALLFLLVTDTAIGIYFLFRLRPEIHQLVRLIFADLSLGVMAGFGARILFKKRSWFIRFITATASLIVGLLALGVLTSFQLGFGPLYFWRTTIDWFGLAHIGLGMNCMLLAMRAWTKPANPVAGSVTTAEAPPQIEIRTRQKRKRTRPAPALSVSTNQQASKVERRSKPVISRKRNAKTETKSTPVHYSRKSKVRLSLTEKHLCPYCLEPVVRNDPRGIVECEICHTLHHGDCWAIAGFCQVPHYRA